MPSTLKQIIQVIVYSLVEAVSEWLPISSTGHLILLDEVWPMLGREAFKNAFLVLVQLGAVLAVLVLYWSEIWPFVTAPARAPGQGLPPAAMSTYSLGPLHIDKRIFAMWVKIAVACVPAAVVGIFFDDLLEEHFYNAKTVSIALFVVGLLFLLMESPLTDKWREWAQFDRLVNRIEDVTWMDAIYIGLFQMLAAMFPGTSRSGATILAALMLGFSRVFAAEFTFIMAIPVMAGASLLKIIKHLHDLEPSDYAFLLLGMAVAFVASLFVIKALMGYVRQHSFVPFAWYRIVLGIIVWLLLV